MSDFGDVTTPVAVKDHRCIWCGETVPKGTQYKRFRGRWDGTWQNWGMHDECMSILDADGGGEFVPYAGVREHYDD